MKICRAIAAAAFLFSPAPGFAFEPMLPPLAVPNAEDRASGSSTALPIGPWSDGSAKAISAEGRVIRRVWRLPESGATPLQLIEPLRTQLDTEGFAILFDCADRQCGGFDFRFDLDLIPAPGMFVDLGNYRYLVARRVTNGEPEFVSVVTSRSAGTGFIHVTEVLPEPEAPLPIATALDETSQVETTPEGGIQEMLDGAGFAVLKEVRFESGSSRLEGADYPELEELARYLGERPDVEIALVGHTDAVGSLDANRQLSSARAAAVRQRLIEAHGVDPARVQAAGVGWLAPRSSNMTDEGRAANRRVEVVLLPRG